MSKIFSLDSSVLVYEVYCVCVLYPDVVSHNNCIYEPLC